jgi:hypothetical protein
MDNTKPKIEKESSSLENYIANYLISGQYKIVEIGRSYKEKKAIKKE